MRRGVVALVAALVVLVPCAFAGEAQKLTLTLDWTPNPDHVGIYDAQSSGLFARAGLDVAIRSPSDPTAPLKLVGIGKSDLAISYEQELSSGAAKKLPIVAVAAVVPQPLNSFIAIEPTVRSLHDLKGKTIGISGIPSDYATLDTALRSVGLTRSQVKIVAVGYELLPALLAHRVDAVLGVYRNVEGIQLQLRGLHPTIIPVNRAGVPSYDELVLVANKTRLNDDQLYRSEVKRFVGAFLTGTVDARAHPARAVAIMKKVTASDPKLLALTVPATLSLLAGPTGVGCLGLSAWQRFGNWMHATGLLKKPIDAGSIMTTRFLPSRCR